MKYLTSFGSPRQVLGRLLLDDSSIRAGWGWIRFCPDLFGRGGGGGGGGRLKKMGRHEYVCVCVCVCVCVGVCVCGCGCVYVLLYLPKWVWCQVGRPLFPWMTPVR